MILDAKAKDASKGALMTAWIDRFFVPILIALSPALTFIVTWSLEGDLSAYQRFMRTYSLPLWLCELAVIVIAVRESGGRTLFDGLKRVQIFLPLLILVGVAFWTAWAVAPNPLIAYLRNGLWLTHLLFGLSIWRLAGRKFSSQDFVDALIAGYLFVSLMFLVFVSSIPDPQSFDWTNDLPLASHIRHFGYYSAAMAGLAIGIVATKPPSSWRWPVGVIVILLSFTFAFWSGTRGALAASAGGLAIGVVVLPTFRKFRVLTLVPALLAVSAAASLTLPSYAGNMGLDRTISAAVGDQEGGLTTGRTVMWRKNWHDILERSLVGYGEGQMISVSRHANAIQPHNVLMQVLLAWGFIGLICILSLTLPLAWRTITIVRKSPGELAAPFVAMASLAAYSLFDGTFFHVLPLALFAAFLGITLAPLSAREASGPERAAGAIAKI